MKMEIERLKLKRNEPASEWKRQSFPRDEKPCSEREEWEEEVERKGLKGRSESRSARLSFLPSPSSSFQPAKKKGYSLLTLLQLRRCIGDLFRRSRYALFRGRWKVGVVSSKEEEERKRRQHDRVASNFHHPSFPSLSVLVKSSTRRCSFDLAMDGESNISKTESNLDPSFPPQDDPSSSSSSSTPFSAPPPRPLDPSSSATTDVSMEDVLQGEAELDVGSVDGSRQTVSGEERVRTELTKENEDTSTSNSQNPLFNHQPSTSEQTHSLSERPTLPFNPFTVEKPQEMDVEAVEGSSSSNHLPLPPPPPPTAGLSSFPSPSASFPPSHPSSNTPGATFNPQLPFNASSSTLPEPEQPVASTSSLPPPTTAFSRPSRTATSVSAAAASHRRAARGVSKPEPEPEPEHPSEVTLTLAQKRKLVSRKQEEITRVMSRHDDLVSSQTDFRLS